MMTIRSARCGALERAPVLRRIVEWTLTLSVYVAHPATGTTWSLAAETANPVGAVYNITLSTDNKPDLTDVDSYSRSVTARYATPQEQAVSIWRWSQYLRKQTTNPIEDGYYVLDSIQMFNSYGYCNCGIVLGVNNALWLNMGWKARYVQLGDHTVCECSWDEGKSWHMFDSSMSCYCFNDRGEVASVTEIEQNPRFYLEQYAPECGTNPVTGPIDRVQQVPFPVVLAKATAEAKHPGKVSVSDGPGRPGLV